MFGVINTLIGVDLDNEDIDVLVLSSEDEDWIKLSFKGETVEVIAGELKDAIDNAINNGKIY